jgi:hypothetical protein
MKAFAPNILCSFVLAAPFCWLAYWGLIVSAIAGYITALALYWLIQAVTDFRRPSNGLLVLGLLSFLYAVLLPAYVKPPRVRPKSVHPVLFHPTQGPNEQK